MSARNALMRHSTFIAALLLAAACAALPPTADGDSGALTYLGGVAIPGEGGVGGLSGLSVTADGARFTAVGDTGTVAAGRLIHDEAGRLAGVADLSVRPLGGLAGSAKRDADAEALAQTPDGDWLVSFERDHRILLYALDQGGLAAAPRRLAMPPEAERLPANDGIEALTVFRDGTVLAIAEAGDDAGRHAAWIGGEGNWRAFRYRTDPAFSPTDAVALPSGDLLVLERHFSLLGGLQGRLTFVPGDRLRAGGTVDAVPLGAVAPPIGLDNFEGLAVRPGADGERLVYILSDDNFSALQRTLLVQYALRLPGQPAARGR